MARFSTGVPRRRGGPSSDIASQESLRALAKRYGINQNTATKWKCRTSMADLPTGLKEACSTVLSLVEEAVVVAFRKHTLLPLDDCFVRFPAHAAEADPIVTSPLPAAAWHFASAAGRGRGFGQAQCQGLPGRRLSHRHR